MSDYMDYTNCGGIIVAPSLSYKHQYLLKCGECTAEYFSAFDEFIIHHQQHHNDDVKKLGDEEHEFNVEINLLPPSQLDDCIRLNEADTNTNGFKGKDTDSTIKVDPLEEPLQDQEDDVDEHYAEDVDDDNSQSSDEWELEDSKKIRVRDFIKSEKNLATFIDAYKRQPGLWNDQLYPTKFRDKEKRASYLEEIVADMKNELNISMDASFADAVIKRMRIQYRKKLYCLRLCEQRGETLNMKLTPDWYFEKLNFLDPFFDNFSIDVIGSPAKKLKPEQIIQILGIYKRFPCLWNTNLVENVCKNKRTEAIQGMTKVLESEMNIQVDETALNKYLMCIHKHFTTQSGYRDNKKSPTEDLSVYYDHMMFLSGHVAPLYCSICNRMHKHPLYLKVHENVKHGLEPLRCPSCNKEYIEVQAYIFHARKHMDDTCETCTECGKTFVKVVDFKAHMRGHYGIKKYFCEICGSSYTLQTSLIEHRKKHDERYKSACPICSKVFYCKKRLDLHIRTHSDVRNYICQICGKAFKERKTLRQHVTIHEEGRNHPCPLCGKMFKNKIGVHHHVKTHRSKVPINLDPFSRMSK